jgi:colanic acid/amylovoran biosynthesis glycosyltransferase
VNHPSQKDRPLANDGTLLILPSFRAQRPDGKVILTGKFLSGVRAYQQHWTGPVRVLIEETDTPDDNLDHVAVDPADLPFDLHLVSYDDPSVETLLARSAVALLSMHYRQTPLSGVCARLGVPAVYVTEYSLETRLQILRAQRLNPLVRLRRMLWERGEERRCVRALREAGHVQCNGTPTFRAYQPLVQDALLYFDTRLDADMLATATAVKTRIAEGRRSGILRLAFSGRLIAIKGADHLVRVAAELKMRSISFEFLICGAGELEHEMRESVKALSLDDDVKFLGTLDFATGLMPLLRERIDLFVCCHRQGDPSCTYLETMGCGVPIVGYANAAFRGIVETSGAGWTVPMNDPVALAEKIAVLARQPDEIESHSLRSLAFAQQHTFEKTFAARINHLRRLSRPVHQPAPTCDAARQPCTP